jgi:hypothetical protein
MLNAALVREDWEAVRECELEIELKIKRATRFRRLALVSTIWPIIVLVAVALLVAAFAALAVLS